MADRTIEYFEQKLRESKQRREQNSKASQFLDSLSHSFAQGIDMSLENLDRSECNEKNEQKEFHKQFNLEKSKILELTIENEKSEEKDNDSFSRSINCIFSDMDKISKEAKKTQEEECIKEMPNILNIQQESNPQNEFIQTLNMKPTPIINQIEQFPTNQKQNQENKLELFEKMQKTEYNQIEQKPSKELGIINDIDLILQKQKKRLQFDLPISEMARHLNKPMDFTTRKKEFTIEDPESAVQKILSKFKKQEVQTTTIIPQKKLDSPQTSNQKQKTNQSLEKSSDPFQSKLRSIIESTKIESNTMNFPDVKFIEDVCETKKQETFDKNEAEVDDILYLIESQQKLNEQRKNLLNSSQRKSDQKGKNRVVSEEKEKDVKQFKDSTPKKSKNKYVDKLSPSAQIQVLKQEKKELQQQQNSIERKQPKNYLSLKENIQQIKKVYHSSEKKSDYFESSNKKNDFYDQNTINNNQNNKFHDFLIISPVKKEENSQYYDNSNAKENLSYSQSIDCSVFQEILKESQDPYNKQDILAQQKTLEEIYEEDEILQNLISQANGVEEEINNLNEQINLLELQI